jgi:hypothetical protein
MADCDSVHNYITPLPIGISKQLAPLIIREFISMIQNCYGIYFHLNRTSSYGDERKITEILRGPEVNHGKLNTERKFASTLIFFINMKKKRL